MPTRREFLKMGGATAAAYALTRNRLMRTAFAAPAAMGLSDPALQPKFVELAPNALDPGFIFQTQAGGPLAGQYKISIKQSSQQTGLVNQRGKRLWTDIWGYGYDDERGVTWPGRTFEVHRSANPATPIRWENSLLGPGGKPLEHLLPVDTSLHWAYSLPGYQGYSIKKNGVPIITHLHGGHSDFQFDGNPEFFYSPDYQIIGPQWYLNGLAGIQKDFVYDNDVPAGTLWYHDHALGITRLNVYAGLAGFYFVRDGFDTGQAGSPLPIFPYELAYAIQDRMFTDKGALFYPGFPGDPFWEDFITGEGLADNAVPQPSALAEFFGDHMVVNGKIWPKTNVEPRDYRLRLLNGTDSRFLVIQFVEVPAGVTDPNHADASDPLDFYVIGSDQGLAGSATMMDTLVFEPGGRYDIVFNFAGHTNTRIIMKNLGGDAPFGGAYGDDLDPADLFPDRQTDRIMAFDVVLPVDGTPVPFNPSVIDGYGGNDGVVANTRKVALFEGTDEYGRLQPLLGTVENDGSATAYPWHMATTEQPENETTEIWEIYNFTADAHPIHLHLVNFQILSRQVFEYTVDENNPQQILQHNGLYGAAPNVQIVGLADNVVLEPGDGYFEDAPKDMVTALPGDPEPMSGNPTGQVTRIKVTFDKTGRYVWHCHILSHEDHEMMRVLQVVPAS